MLEWPLGDVLHGRTISDLCPIRLLLRLTEVKHVLLFLLLLLFKLLKDVERQPQADVLTAKD